MMLAFVAMSCEQIQDFIDEKGHGLVFLEGEMKAYFDDKGDTKNYKFKADLAWSAEVSANWVEVDPTSGPAGENKIQIKVDKNKSDEKRTGYVDITLSNDKSYRIELEQLASGENLDDVIQPTNSCPSNEIWYTSADGNIVEPYSGEGSQDNFAVFGANIVSNTFDAEKECWVIKFDGDVTSIGYAAFYNCTSLTSVTIPDSVTAIGEWAFGDCGSLTSVTMGEGVETVGGYAFANCPNLNAVHITDLAVWCNIDFINPKTDGGIVFSANPLCHGARLYLNKELVTDLIIPDGITEIRMMTFSGCTSLTSVTIPDGVTTIGRGAFIGCSSITNVIIPDGVTTIRSLVFCGCISLKSVTIPSSVTEIGTQAFCWCYSLTSITIPNNLTTMGVAVFGYCNNLSEFNGPLVSEDGKCLVIDGKLFAFAPEGLTEYTIPNGVTTIGNYAFLGCSGLTSVTIPDSVTTIGRDAFYNCSSLTSVYCRPATPPTAEVYDNYWHAFDENASGRIIYVPTESVDAYKSADGWSEYADRIVGYDFENDCIYTPESTPATKAWLGDWSAYTEQTINIETGEINQQRTDFSFNVSVVDGYADRVYVDGLSVMGKNNRALGYCFESEDGGYVLYITNQYKLAYLGDGYSATWLGYWLLEDGLLVPVYGDYPLVYFIMDANGNISSEVYVGMLDDGRNGECVAFDIISVNQNSGNIAIVVENGKPNNVWKYGDIKGVTKVELPSAQSMSKSANRYNMGNVIPHSMVVASL